VTQSASESDTWQDLSQAPAEDKETHRRAGAEKQQSTEYSLNRSGILVSCSGTALNINCTVSKFAKKSYLFLGRFVLGASPTTASHRKAGRVIFLASCLLRLLTCGMHVCVKYHFYGRAVRR
jgi:hypothetical protein